jgi:hypothetical protein
VILTPPPQFSDAACGRPGVGQVHHIEEVELCYIPMGGAIPKRNQRVVAFGGSLGLVHPATGYQICRCLAAAGPTARALAEQVRGRLARARLAAGGVTGPELSVAAGCGSSSRATLPPPQPPGRRMTPSGPTRCACR